MIIEYFIDKNNSIRRAQGRMQIKKRPLVGHYFFRTACFLLLLLLVDFNKNCSVWCRGSKSSQKLSIRD